MLDSRQIPVCSFLAALALLLLGAASPPAGTKKLGALADRLRAAQKGRPAGKPRPVSFRVTEREWNEHLAYLLRSEPRPGVERIVCSFRPENQVTIQSAIDFDDVERARPGTIPVLLRPILRGKRTIEVGAQFRATDGTLSYDVRSASFQDIPIPPAVVKKVIQSVASRQPEHYDTTRPIPLGWGLQTVWTEDGALLGQNH